MRSILVMVIIIFSLLGLLGCESADVTIHSDTNTNIEQSINIDNEDRKTVQTDRNFYKIDVTLDANNKKILASQQVIYVNSENIELKELYFHIYTNAFKTKDTIPYISSDFNKAYPEGFNPGYTDFTSIKLNNKDANYYIQGEDSTILKIQLDSPLKPGKTVNLEMNYTIYIPQNIVRFGWNKTAFNLGNWYPIAAVYDTKGWHLDEYYKVGDPFYSDAADYNISIITPKEYIVAASGDLASETLSNSTKTFQFTGTNMRDFAFIANSNFKIIKTTVDGITIQSYCYDTNVNEGKNALDAAVQAIEVYNNKFGKYPYSTFSVVETEFESGMEYPGLIYVSSSRYKSSASPNILLGTVVHETAHQWWYSAVGNDEVNEAWLDEGFARYSETIFVQEVSGFQQGKDHYMQFVQSRYDDAIKQKKVDKTIVKNLSQFKNWDDYSLDIYTKGAVVLNELRNRVGDEKFFLIMQQYYKTYKFKNASIKDFIQISEQITGQNLDEFFNSWLY